MALGGFAHHEYSATFNAGEMYGRFLKSKVAGEWLTEIYESIIYNQRRDYKRARRVIITDGENDKQSESPYKRRSKREDETG
jgi:hypothetical protein